MFRITSSVFALLLFSSTVFAEDVPCRRSAKTPELDVSRCQMLFLQQQLGALQMDLASLQAQQELYKVDLAAAAATRDWWQAAATALWPKAANAN